MKHARGFVSREDEKQAKFVMGQYFEVSFFFCNSFSLFFLWEIQMPYRVLPLPLMLLHDLYPDMMWNFERFFHQRSARSQFA
jgi:hypothetical protein